MSLIRLNNLSKSFEETPILRKVFFRLSQGDRVGLIGRNGAGKTTLLKLMLRLEEPNEGAVEIALASKPTGDELDRLLYRQATKLEQIEQKEGWNYQYKIDTVLSKLGFSTEQRIRTLSGGQRARVALAKSLLSGASVILLDEPTNHLDMASTQVMERALAYFPGAIIVISHDRFFIDKIATQLLVFEGEDHLRKVNGNWTTWRAGVE
jgi:ATP-binding cassette subfamily F protein 3